MDRRRFLLDAARTAVMGSMAAAVQPSFGQRAAAPSSQTDASNAPVGGHGIGRLRFGVNYTPSRNWWFCWNDWDAGAIQKDFDGIRAVGADHVRVLLIWPYFQPNPTWVSPLHLDRLDQMLGWMQERQLDAVITVFTGQLSGWFFLPPFNKAGSGFYTSPGMWSAQRLFVRELAAVLLRHDNIIGFDIGNEVNTCWETEPATGNSWMRKMLSLMNSAVPAGLHVNGVDSKPWFEPTTFSPQALAALPMPAIHCYPFWTGALRYGGPMDPPSVDLPAAMAALVHAYAGHPDKPIWVEEFNTCIESLSEAQQAEWLEKAVLKAIDSGVSWFTYWDSHDVDRSFDFNSLEYSLGLLTNDGRVKDQGKTFKQLAEAYRGKPVSSSTRSAPPLPAVQTNSATWRWLMDWMGWKPSPA